MCGSFLRRVTVATSLLCTAGSASASIPRAAISGFGPGIQYAPAQGQAAAELLYFSGIFSILSAQYRFAAGYEFAQQVPYVRGGVGAGFILASLNLELFQPLKSGTMGTAFVPNLTILLPCSSRGSSRAAFLCEPFAAAHLAFKTGDEHRFLIGLRLLFADF